METRTYCVYNKPKESFLSVGVTPVDTAVEPFKVLKTLTEEDALNDEMGLWLTPFRGIFVAQTYAPFDLVYLDEEYRVIAGVESNPAVGFAPFKGQAACALVLPPHSIFSSHTHPGDQLVICVAEELVRHHAQLPISTTPALGTLSTELLEEELRGDGGSTPTLPDDRFSRPQAAVETLDVKREVERLVLENEPAVSQVLPWAEELVRHFVGVPVSTTLVPVIWSREPLEEELLVKGGSAALVLDHRFSRPQAAVEPFAVKREVERLVLEIEPTVSQVLPWAEEPEQPVVGVPISTMPTTVTWSREPLEEEFLVEGGSAAPVSDDSFSRPQAALDPFDVKREAEPLSLEIEPTVSEDLPLAEEAEQPVENVPISTTPAPVIWSREPLEEEFLVEGGSAAPVSDDSFSRPQAAPEPLDVKREVEPLVLESEATVSEVLPWAEEVEQPIVGLPISTTPAQGTLSTEPLEEPLLVDDGSALILPDDWFIEPQAALEPLDEKKEVEALVLEIERAVSQVLREAEEPERPLKSVPISNAPAPVTKRTDFTTEQPRGKSGSAPSSPEDRFIRQQAAIEPLDEKKEVESKVQAEDSLKARFLRWLNPETPPRERRKSTRRPVLGLVAYYWNGGPPQAHKINDISDTGFYMLTKDRWAPETMIQMTLQRTGSRGEEDPGDAISVLSKVVRSDLDGVGHEFVLAKSVARNRGNMLPGSGTDKEALKRFL
jgi:hypothetical protein